jgi:apolipoprotein N-acyltransferase
MALRSARRVGWALLSGVLLWLSFPNPFALHFEAWPGRLAFVALVPLLAVLEDCSPTEGFQFGFLAGSACFLPGLLWITYVRPLGPGAIPAWCGLAAWCALFPALFGALAALGLRKGWRAPLLWLPALWTLTEALREHLLTGFPWLNLGSSQFVNPAVLPLAALTGQVGLDYAVAMVNAVVCALLVWPHWILSWKKTLSALGMLLALGLGAHQQAAQQSLWDVEGSGPIGRSGSLKVALVQGGINEDQAWTIAYRKSLLDTYLGLSDAAVAQGARLVVWPESSFPGFFNENAPEALAVKDFARSRKVSLLIGSTLSTEGVFTNSAVLVDPQGNTLSYAKRHLVPFGEYVPFRQWIPFLDRVLDRFGVEGFGEGSGPAVFSVNGCLVAPQICYESVFPDLAREGPAPDFLVVLTDDTWYGVSAGPVWHAGQIAVRAVENGCWAAQDATTGVSLIASPEGRITSSIGLTELGVLVQTLGPARPTPWRRHGLWFLWLCAGILAFSCVFCVRPVKNR